MASEKVKEILRIPRKDITINKNDILGRGGYGVVFSGIYREKKVAVKLLIDKGLVPNSDREAMEKEAGRLLELGHHLRVIALYGVLMEENNYGLVTEYMHFGNSFIFVNQFNVEGPLLLRITMDVASAMQYLHSFNPPMLHKDLKAENVLIDYRFNAKVCDFGLSKWKTVTKSMTGNIPSTGAKGTISHIAPEVWKNINCKFTKEIDVYAFGITVWELFTGKRPYEDKNENLISYAVCDNQRPDPGCLCEDCPEIINLMLNKCWHQEPNQRPQFHVIYREIEKVFREEHEHKIKRIIKSLRDQICKKFSKSDPKYICTTYIDDLETDLMSVPPVRPQESSLISSVKPTDERPSEFIKRTASKNAGALAGSSGIHQNENEAMENSNMPCLQLLNIQDSSSSKTSELQDGLDPKAKASEIIDKTVNKIGTVHNPDNHQIGDTHQQRNEDMMDAVVEQNTDNNDNSQSRKMEQEQKNNNEQYVVRPKDTKMPDYLPEPSVVKLKNSNDVLQGLEPLKGTATDREIIPEQPYSSVEVDEFSKKGTFGPEPPKRSHADPLQPRAEIPDSNMQPQAGPQPYIYKRSNTSEKPPNKSEPTSRHPPKYRNQTSEGGTPPPNQTPPMGGATRFGEPVGQPGRMTISHQHSGGGFTHIDMDQNSKVQPNVQVGDRNVMVVGGSRNSDSDDERRGAKTSTKRKSKKKSNRHLKLPDKPVENDDIDVVCVDIGRDWKRLCRGLGLDDPRIEQIYQDYHVSGQYELMYQSLRVWKNKTGKAATVRALGQSLLNIDRDDLIKKLYELYRD